MHRTVVVMASLLIAVPPTYGGSHAAPSRDAAQSAAPPQWGALIPGPHGVGFRLAPQYDHSRRVAPRVDFEGRPQRGSVSMPMPVAIWYPAARTRSSAPMQ